MIEFVSLMLGLVTGFQYVEVSVAGPVAEIELLLDGRTVEVLEEEPWRFGCELGPGLEPHELVAIARDAGGQELDRARQWVNVQKQPVAGAALVFSGGERGRPEAVGLVWESIGQRRPSSVEIELDGVPLEVRDPEHIPLPAYDPQQLHFLSATVRFQDHTVSYLDAGFGGGRGSEIATALTAVAVTLEKGTRMPSRERLERWFLKDGEPVGVQGVEKGIAEVVIVRDPALQAELEELVGRIDSWDVGRVGKRAAYGDLGEGTHLRVMSPAGAPLAPDEVTAEMFVRSASKDAGDSGLLWLTQQVRPQSFAMLFPNAVALAGMQAHASTRRRAVVLLLGGSQNEWNLFPPSEARRYLRLLQVPFFVWSLTPEPQKEWEDTRAVPLGPEPRAGHKRLKRAVEDLRKALDAQRIVWLEGRHLPQSIELAPEAVGIRLAGSS